MHVYICSFVADKHRLRWCCAAAAHWTTGSLSSTMSCRLSAVPCAPTLLRCSDAAPRGSCLVPKVTLRGAHVQWLVAIYDIDVPLSRLSALAPAINMCLTLWCFPRVQLGAIPAQSQIPSGPKVKPAHLLHLGYSRLLSMPKFLSSS